MWLFLSRRLRTWLLLAVGVPIVRAVIRRLAGRAAERSPDARSARLLRRANSSLDALSRRRRQSR